MLRYIKSVASQLRVATVNIKYYHFKCKLVIIMPESNKPKILPISPHADHAPVISPYFYTSK
jgi:hypothetical protein